VAKTQKSSLQAKTLLDNPLQPALCQPALCSQPSPASPLQPALCQPPLCQSALCFNIGSIFLCNLLGGFAHLVLNSYHSSKVISPALCHPLQPALCSQPSAASPLQPALCQLVPWLPALCSQPSVLILAAPFLCNLLGGFAHLVLNGCQNSEVISPVLCQLTLLPAHPLPASPVQPALWSQPSVASPLQPALCCQLSAASPLQPALCPPALCNQPSAASPLQPAFCQPALCFNLAASFCAISWVVSLILC
jgi:hypothetical protein